MTSIVKKNSLLILVNLFQSSLRMALPTINNLSIYPLRKLSPKNLGKETPLEDMSKRKKRALRVNHLTFQMATEKVL